MRSAARDPSEAARAAAHAALAALPLAAATLAPLLLAGAGCQPPGRGLHEGLAAADAGAASTPAAATRHSKRARKTPAGTAKDPNGYPDPDANTTATAPAPGATAGGQLPALLELLHWKTDLADAGARLAPLCAVLRALSARGAAAARGGRAGAGGDAGAAGLLDSDDERGDAGARDAGCGVLALALDALGRACLKGTCLA